MDETVRGGINADLGERMWQLRRPVVDMAAGYGIAAGDGIMAMRSSATACSITEGYLAPQAQELREWVLGSAALVDFVGICDDEYCGEARQCGGEFAPAGRVARRLHHRPSGTVRHGARHMEVAVGTPAHHKTLFGYASIGVSACERGWSWGRVSAWSVGGEHWVGGPQRGPTAPDRQLRGKATAAFVWAVVLFFLVREFNYGSHGSTGLGRVWASLRFRANSIERPTWCWSLA